MLIRITNACQMGCSHCLADAKPDGEHMAPETFRACLDLASRIGFPVVLVSGGEPTDHPAIETFLEASRAAGMASIVLSNGLFLSGDPPRRDRIISLAHMVQVTNDPRYYPRHVADFSHTKVVFERNIRLISRSNRSGSRSRR